jgi:ABC-type transport system substrate-binding protein
LPSTATSAPTIVQDISIATFDGISLSVPPEECNGAYTGLIQSVVATDASTVTFTLCRPEPDFLFKISLSAFGIYPSEWIEATADAGTRTSQALENPVGTGPYMVSEWKRGESLTLTANPNYWAGTPMTGMLVMRWSTDPAARLAELQAGIVDGIDNVSPTDFAAVRGDSLVALMERPALNAHDRGIVNAIASLTQLAGGHSGVAYRADVINPQASPLGAETFHLSAPGDREAFIWLQSAEPLSLFCADEADVDSLRACAQVAETLYRFDLNSTAPVPTLAQACEPNADKTIWTCILRQDVTFHDASAFDAQDVVATFNLGLNTGSPFHAGNSNLWEYYNTLWGLLKKPGG